MLVLRIQGSDRLRALSSNWSPLSTLQVAAVLLIFQAHVFHQFQAWL